MRRLPTACFAHADETDDSHAPSLTHPGCGIVPAALAMAERETARRHRDAARGGARLRRGLRLTLSLRRVPFRDVGSLTHSFGPTFGAAAACAALARFNATVRHVLSYTAQQTSGISCWMRDPEHVEKAFDFGGMPARNGVTAARWSAHGLSGVEDVFSGERNFFVAYPPRGSAGARPRTSAKPSKS